MKDGESLAIIHLAKALASSGNEVTMLAMNTSKHRIEIENLNDALPFYAAIHTVEVDNRIKIFPAIQNLFSEKSYHIQRFENQAFNQKLVEVLTENEFDVVQLETPYLTPYLSTIRKFSDAKIVMRAHNVEHEIWERIAENAHFLKKIYLKHITPRLRDFEISHLNDYDLVAGISERDVFQFQKLGLKREAMVLPIGLDCTEYRPDFRSFDKPLSLCFIGSLDWQPNLEGLKWFLEKVWQPILAKEFPTLTLHIAGRNTPNWLKNLAQKNVVVHGEVANSQDFINQHSMMVVPLLSGSGMRAKILENMALGKVSLTTSMGLEGIPARHRREILLADTPNQFANEIRWAISNPKPIKNIGKSARVFCETNYDNLLIGRQLIEVYEQWHPVAEPEML